MEFLAPTVWQRRRCDASPYRTEQTASMMVLTISHGSEEARETTFELFKTCDVLIKADMRP